MTELGKNPFFADSRDAIHIAIIPMILDERCQPGDHVGITTEGHVSKNANKKIGIVDPFLKEHQCWTNSCVYVCLYPNSVTGMKHHWEHPDFPEKTSGFTKEESEQWLRNFCASSSGPRYEVFMAAVTDDSSFFNRKEDDAAYEIDNDYLHFSGYDAHGSIPKEVWDHVENVTGVKCKYKPEYFSCSC